MSQLDMNQNQESGDHQQAFDDTGEAMDLAFVASENKPSHTTGLIVLLILVIGGGSLYFMRWKSGPQTAVASAETTTATTTINEFLTDGDRSILAMREMLRNTEKVVQQFINYPGMKQIDVEDLQTNPFVFLLPAERRQDQTRVAQDNEREAAMRAVQALNLQSVMSSGETRTCMINNAAWTEGQEVQGFKIERINDASVIVRKGEYRFELRMKR
jgi:hypothetical protein